MTTIINLLNDLFSFYNISLFSDFSLLKGDEGFIRVQYAFDSEESYTLDEIIKNPLGQMNYFTSTQAKKFDLIADNLSDDAFKRFNRKFDEIMEPSYETREQLEQFVENYKKVNNSDNLDEKFAESFIKFQESIGNDQCLNKVGSEIDKMIEDCITYQLQEEDYELVDDCKHEDTQTDDLSLECDFSKN